MHVLRATRANYEWTWDFVHSHTMSDGRTFKILTVADEHTREPLLVHVARRINAREVIARAGLSRRRRAGRCCRSS